MNGQSSSKTSTTISTKYKNPYGKSRTKSPEDKGGGYTVVPQLQKYRDLIQLWVMILRRKRRVRTNLTKIRRLMEKLGVPDALLTNRKEAWNCLQASCKEYKRGDLHWVNRSFKLIHDDQNSKNSII